MIKDMCHFAACESIYKEMKFVIYKNKIYSKTKYETKNMY